MNIALAGGGTGGHLFPGLAVAEEFRRRHTDARVLLLCTGRDEVYEGTREAGIESVVIPSIHTGSFARRVVALAPAFVRAMQAIGKFRPDVLVGLGGYGSVAPVLCAWLRRIPCILMEQNVVPGRSNRFLARFVREIAAQWEECKPYFRSRGKVRVTGNPIRGFIQRRDRAAVAAELGLRPELPTLLVMGGSQGARPLNDLTLAALPILAAAGVRMQCVHLSGAADAPRASAAYEQYGVPARVFAFLNDMSLAYSVSDLALSRAGGTSIAELTALGIPSILVPYPHATDGHQKLNASSLERRGAALVLDQATLAPHRLAHHVARLLGDADARAAMSRQSQLCGVPRAAAVVVDHIEALANQRNGTSASPAPQRAAHNP